MLKKLGISGGNKSTKSGEDGYDMESLLNESSSDEGEGDEDTEEDDDEGIDADLVIDLENNGEG